MPGMSTGLSANNPTIVSAFDWQLVHQGLVVLLILALVAVAWSILRVRQLHLVAEKGLPGALVPEMHTDPEPAARRVARISFGLIWIFDGVLQAQSSMPLGMAPEVLKPVAASSPSWVQHLDNFVATIWSYHPTTAPASAVWIQVGIGIWLLFASRGLWSRLGGVASLGWGLVVWVFGEAFGQIFAPGLTVLFGAPGAAIFYCAAGALVAVPDRYWTSARLGRIIVRSLGLFLVGMAALQAWPGRGFWRGQAGPHAVAGTLTEMVRQMAHTPQPHLITAWMSAFGRFDAAHGWGVNLFAVLCLFGLGAALLSARPGLVRLAVLVGAVVFLADWVLIEDLGFLGGVGTDPNSMVPMIILLIVGYVAVTRLPAPRPGVAAPIAAVDGSAGAAARQRRWREQLSTNPAFAFRSIAAIGALGITLVGVAPIAAAATNPNADPILSQAINGAPQAEDTPAPPFHLVDQNGAAVTLASLRGKVVFVTFLDDVCVSTCPIIAQELRVADGMLGADASRVEIVAIDANPRFITPDYLRAFDQQEGLTHLANWLYLTGSSLHQLEAAWRAFGAVVQYLPGGAMVDHSEFAEVIDASGNIRYLLNSDPGPGTAATQSSFAVTLADTIKSVIASRS